MKKKIILWILVVLWMGVIFYFSSRNAEESTSQSQGLIGKTTIIDNYKEEDKEEALENIDRVFRKITHACVFFVLSILVCLALKEYNIPINKLLLYAFIICFLYACSDEIHQIYVPGRSGEFRDVLIDNIGVVIGLVPFKLFSKRSVKK